jgi:hypothetical protein
MVGEYKEKKILTINEILSKENLGSLPQKDVFHAYGETDDHK